MQGSSLLSGRAYVNNFQRLLAAPEGAAAASLAADPQVGAGAAAGAVAEGSMHERAEGGIRSALCMWVHVSLLPCLA